jgi:glutaredoxin 2
MFIIGCNPIDKHLKKEVKLLPDKLVSMNKTLVEKSDSYEASIKENSVFAKAAETEKLSSNFNQSASILKKIEGNIKKCQSYVKENDGDKNNLLRAELKSFKTNLNDFNKKVNYPSLRLKEYLDIVEI